MRITLLANRDLASCVALNYLLPQLEGHELTLFLSAAVGGAARKEPPQPLADLKFTEQTLFNDILFPLFDATCTPNGGRSPADRSGQADGSGIIRPSAGVKPPTLRSFAGLGERLQAPARELNDINSGAGHAAFAASEPDLALSIRYGVILKEAALAVPKKGVLNLHSGALPDYRGVMASFWAMLHDEATLGTTLHVIDDPGIDTGPVIARTALPCVPDRSYLWHVLELYKDGCRVMAAAVARLARGESLPSERQVAGGNYFSFPRQGDLERFHAKGLKLTDGAELMGLCRGFLPGRE